MVIETLRGSKSERVHRLGLDKLSTYGISEQSAHQLRLIMQHLIMNGYLVKTDDEYPVIKLGSRSKEILRDGASVHMKLPKEKEKKAPKPEKYVVKVPVDSRLLAALREVRRAIAEEQNLPAFVIFHDSTLTDMCIKLPISHASLLQVSGIGRVKAERYGKRFLEVISEHVKLI